MLKVLIADDQGIVRKGLQQILMEGFKPVRLEEAETPETLIEKVRSENWDIVIGNLADRDQVVKILSRINLLKPELRMLILGFNSDAEFADSIVEEGASGYLSKDAAPKEILNAVNHILGGKTYTRTTAEETKELNTIPLHELLSEREKNVFKLLSKGLSIASISETLSIGTSTVSTYRSRILAKLNKRNNADLIKYAVDHELL